MDVPEVSFADAGGVSIAWTQFGSGPDVLAVPPIVSNMEIVWEHEYFRRFFEYIARFVRVTAFDKRGVGLSDKFHEKPTLEQRTNDILAVMNAAGLERPSLLGVSEGGLMSQLFAAIHPDRVDRLALANAQPGATGMVAVHRDPDGSLRRLAQLRERFEVVLAKWGRDPQVFVDLFSPSNSNNPAFVRWVGRLQRQSATQADIRRQTESLLELDAVTHLADIRAPTIIVNCSSDQVIPASAGRYLGDRITGAVVRTIESDDHFVETGPHWQQMADTWLEFILGDRPTRHSERRVATIVFTDIVDSTVRTRSSGDQEWRHVLDEHDRIAWATADHHSGTIIKSTGDGLLARFDAPSRALAFTMSFRHALKDVGLRIRCGVHTGEVELRENGDITGTAVNLAARVEQAADHDAICVSSTVHDLLLGGDLHFTDLGTHALKGFERPWQLFALVD